MLLALWQLIGCVICVAWAQTMDANDWELCNPYWSYKYHYSVNWFGAVIISLIYTILCPFGALIYWLYKLCTVGRR